MKNKINLGQGRSPGNKVPIQSLLKNVSEQNTKCRDESFFNSLQKAEDTDLSNTKRSEYTFIIGELNDQF